LRLRSPSRRGVQAGALALLVILPAARAQAAEGDPTLVEITQAVAQAVDHYTAAIACTHSPVQPKDIAALVPYGHGDQGEPDGVWAVAWMGEIACLGGSSGSEPQIAVVSVHHGNYFLVDPGLSSPQVRFEAPVKYVDRLVGNTGDTLVLEGMAYADGEAVDAMCCPSVRKRFTMKQDDKGNWKSVRERVVPNKKK